MSVSAEFLSMLACYCAAYPHPVSRPKGSLCQHQRVEMALYSKEGRWHDMRCLLCNLDNYWYGVIKKSFDIKIPIFIDTKTLYASSTLLSVIVFIYYDYNGQPDQLANHYTAPKAELSFPTRPGHLVGVELITRQYGSSKTSFQMIILHGSAVLLIRLVIVQILLLLTVSFLFFSYYTLNYIIYILI